MPSLHETCDDFSQPIPIVVRKTGVVLSPLRLAGVSTKADSCRGLGMRLSWGCQTNVFRMVAAVLALGDVDFVERSEARDGDPLSDLAEASRPRLEAAASLLHVSPEAILSALISRKINAGISSQVGPVPLQSLEWCVVLCRRSSCIH